MNKDNYVYCFIDENKIPFYIGLGKYNRWNTHLIPSVLRTLKLPSFYAKLSKMIRLNIHFEILLLRERITRTEAEYSEQILIKMIGRKDLNSGPLRNLTDGGDGAIRCIVSDETRRKLSKKNKGRKLSIEHIERLRSFNLGKKHSDESKRRMSKSQKGVSKFAKNKEQFIEKCVSASKLRLKNNDYVKKHLNMVREKYRKKVFQYGLDGVFIKEWEDQYIAIENIGKGRADRLISCCDGKSNNHCGYIWRYDGVFKNK